MTSKLTRDRLAEIAQFGFSSAITPANDFEIKELARLVLYAMGSEPVAEVLSNRPGNDTSIVDVALPVGTQLYRHAQPAPVVPDVMEPTIEAIKRILPTSNPDEYAACIGADMWNTCRSAMLQELKKSAGTEATCRSDENVQVLHTKSPVQSDCCPAQNHVSPEQGGNSLVIPDEMTSGQAYEIGYYYGDPVDVFARGANWMRQHIIDSTLAAAPQEPKP